MLNQKIDEDLKKAMKNKDEVGLSTLRMLRAAIKNKEIEKRSQNLSDSELFEIIQKQIKQRKDSIQEFLKGNRKDLADREAKEITILEPYLPKQLTEMELATLIRTAIQKVGAASKADLGKVMKEVMPQITGKADGKLVSQVAANLL